MTQSMQVDSVVENAKWEMESALARKNAELETVQQKSDALQASVKKLEAELSQQHASSQLELDNCRRACNDMVADKDAELKDMQMKIERLHDLVEKQVIKH